MVSGYKKNELIYSEKPEVVLGYRNFMGGVDKVHQFCACFSFTTKSYKWGERAIFLVCIVAIVNSFTLSNTDKKRKRGETRHTSCILQKSHHYVDRQCDKNRRPSSSSDKKTGWMEKFISSYRRKTSQQKNAFILC
jgi:hypothetical protein